LRGDDVQDDGCALPTISGRLPDDLLGASLQFTDSGNRCFVWLWGSNMDNQQVAINLTISTHATSVGLLAPRTLGALQWARSSGKWSAAARIGRRRARILPSRPD
jgi:hypothetical protein